MPDHNVLFLTGQKQGRLKIGWGFKGPDGKRWYKCQCYCGNPCEYPTAYLRHNVYPRQSCGRCYDADKYKAEYHTWENIMDRCYNKNRARYHNYGGRGITVCQRWRQDFLFFLEDMGIRPGPDYSIERIDVDGNYEPTNCKWIPNWMQHLNKTNTIRNT
jgi:hypothetical protein